MAISIDHTPCVTDQEVINRIVYDQIEINKMVDEGYDIITMVSWQPPETFECHCLPIFKNDTMEDVCNRYADYFPKELTNTINAVRLEEKYSYRNGMNKMGTMMAYGKIPTGLRKILDVWHGRITGIGDFFDFNNNKPMIEKFFKYMSKLKSRKIK